VGLVKCSRRRKPALRRAARLWILIFGGVVIHQQKTENRNLTPSTTPPLLIRPAGLTDLRHIFAIEKKSFPLPWSRWAFLAELGHAYSHTLVAAPPPPARWAVWGYLVFWVVMEQMHIVNLAVHPRRRRQGVAKALLAAGLARAKELGATMAWLEVRPSNGPALNLYGSLGFKTVGRRPRYYEDTQEDALLLTLTWDEQSAPQ
jgi:ribosomal-protein-alanine N-acetyltransferase